MSTQTARRASGASAGAGGKRQTRRAMGAAPEPLTHTTTVFAEPLLGTTSSSGEANPNTSIEAVLHQTEAERVRTMALIAVVAACISAVLVMLLPAKELARQVYIAGLLVAVTAGGYILARVRTPQDYRPFHLWAFGASCVVALACCLYFWGVFSSVLMVIPLGAFMLTQSSYFYPAMAIIGGTFVCHFGLTILLITGVLQDNALNPIGAHPVGAQISRLFMNELILLLSFVVARKMRRSTESTLTKLNDAMHAIRQRDALLAEANHELNYARKIDAPGHYTGQVIGNYRLGMVIGHGGNGIVYDARHVANGTNAAVKLLHPHLLTHPEQFRRFAREVRIAAALDDPHLVRLYEAPQQNMAFPYMAMERLYGESLADSLARQPVMPPHELAELVGQVAAGLRAAHRAGIVHRDLKPRNIFLTKDPSDGDAKPLWKILDFGISTSDDIEATLSDQGRIIGTPHYMAPEQACGKPSDYRVDVYALGVIAYRALTGRPPFIADEIPRLLHDVVYSMPPRPSALQPLSLDVDRVLAIALAKQPADRFQSAEELAAALDAALQDALSDVVRARGDALMSKYPWSRQESPARRLTSVTGA